MPRDLTDLMERATSFAPPEPHAADEITRVAVRRQRRRTNGIIGGACAAVLVVAGLGYGVTRHDSKPEPAAPYKYDQQVDVSDAVAASTLPGFELEPWTIPSVQNDLPPHGPVPTYHDVDADGRLIVEDFPDGADRPPRVRFYDSPGRPPRVLPQPPPPPDYRGPSRITWIPSYVGDGRLLWRPDVPSVSDGFHVTDLDGRQDVFVKSSFTVDHGREEVSGMPENGSEIWGDRFWFKAYDHNLPGFRGVAYDLYTATFSGQLTKVAANVADFAVGGGQVAWATTNGHVMTHSASGGGTHTVDVPLDAGCRVPTFEVESLERIFTVGRSVIALTEACGRGKAETHNLVAMDPSGRRLVRIAGTYPFGLSVSGHYLLFISVAADIQVMRYDLVSGSLSTIGVAGQQQGLADPRGAGDHVLWYDRDGGHVARIPQ